MNLGDIYAKARLSSGMEHDIAHGQALEAVAKAVRDDLCQKAEQSYIGTAPAGWHCYKVKLPDLMK